MLSTGLRGADDGAGGGPLGAGGAVAAARDALATGAEPPAADADPVVADAVGGGGIVPWPNNAGDAAGEEGSDSGVDATM